MTDPEYKIDVDVLTDAILRSADQGPDRFWQENDVDPEAWMIMCNEIARKYSLNPNMVASLLQIGMNIKPFEVPDDLSELEK